MKSTGTTRWCALFPWLFRNLEMNAPKDVSGGGTAMVELRGLGDSVSCYERASAAGLSYISLQDVLAAQKRRPSNLTTEVNDLDGLWVSNNHGTPRTPKSRLLEKAARAWLQPTVSNRSLQHSNFFARYWMKYTSHSSEAAPRALHHSQSGTNLSNCIVYFPFLKCFDMTPSENYSREHHALPLLCY
jgi:hypothetical protein